jgi:signal transduction histidine kinase
MDLLKAVKPSRFAFGLACLAAVALLLISELSYRQSVNSLTQLVAMSQARSNLQNFQESVLAAEASERGYLLTRRQEALVPYYRAIKEINAATGFLDTYYESDAESKPAFKRLQSITALRLQELASAIQLFDEGKSQASNNIVVAELSKQQMEAIRELSDQLLDRMVVSVEGRRTNIRQTLMVSRMGMAVLSMVCLLAMYLYLRQAAVVRQHQLTLQGHKQAQSDQFESEVVLRTAELTALTRYLQNAREDERNRLARNLHDDLGALLTSAKLDAARIKTRVTATAPEALALLTHLVATLNQGIALGRSIIEDLRPSALSHLGLVATLEILAREFTEQSGLQVHSRLEPVALSADAGLMVYRLMQEAFTNIIKYANATQVWVTLVAQGDEVIASVRDDGIGFDNSIRRDTAYGLMGMRFRVEAQGGVLRVESAPGQGTLIQVNLPKAT